MLTTLLVLPYPHRRRMSPKKRRFGRKYLQTLWLISICNRKEEPSQEIETTSSDYFASSKAIKVQNNHSAEVNTKIVEADSRSSPRDQAPSKTTSIKKIAAGKSSLDSERAGSALRGDNTDIRDESFITDVRKRGPKSNRDSTDLTGNGERTQQTDCSQSKTTKYHRQTLDTEDTDPMDSKLILDDDGEISTNKHTRSLSTSAATSGKKRKSTESNDDDKFEDTNKSHGMMTTKEHSKKPPSKKSRSTKEDVVENPTMQAIFNSIPTVRAPTPPPKDPNVKFNWRKAVAAGDGSYPGPPPASGSIEIPSGADNCLSGLTFVFTGLLETISREEAQELVKRYGGKVTGQPSSKTSYVVLGSDAGPSKLEKIRKMKIKTINEDGLFELIRQMPENGGDSKNAEKQVEKKRREEEKIKRDAEEMEREEKRLLAAAETEARKAATARGVTTPSSSNVKSSLSSQLWTTKYAPTQASQICGNKGQVLKIQKWLEAWPRNHKMAFQMRGADGTGAERAIIIHGPPGIGKTTAAHLAAKLEGYDIIESNASDTRSKKLVESGLQDVLDNNSLLGFFAGDGKPVDPQKRKIVLIMDEVDGMSAGDRGGVGALAHLCKKTDIPMILICNDRKSQKMKPFDHVTYDVPFRRPTVQEIRSRIASIAAKEGLKLPGQVIDALIEGSNKDIRQIINMLATAKLDQTAMDFEQGRSMTKAWEKHIVLKPWDICHKLLGGGLFAPSSKATLNDKIELYFNDHEFSYLMVQENYLSTKPMLANNANSQKAHRLKTLELADKAAESISDGDLVDRMIHGSQQQWSLMPTHAVFSAVRPASFMSGAMTDRTAFTQWLGNNSKYGKSTRYIKEIQSHMRLRTSGDRHEIRQQYLPVLWEEIIKRLEVEGKDSVEDVIELMDSYFLTRDDFDYMLELGLGDQRQENVKIETQTKAAFTRMYVYPEAKSFYALLTKVCSYNQRSHPLPFMKASNVVAPQKAAKIIPDLEEALEEDDDAEVMVEKDDNDEDDTELKKDKYIKQPKAKKPAGPKKKVGAKMGAIGDVDSGEDRKPKASRGSDSKTRTAGSKFKVKK